MGKFGPLIADHPAVTNGEICPACKKKFVAGDVTTLIELGPGDDPKQQRAAREGRSYSAVAALVHWQCATGGD